MQNVNYCKINVKVLQADVLVIIFITNGSTGMFRLSY